MRNPRFNLTSLLAVIVVGMIAHSQQVLFAREGGAGTRGGGDALICTFQSGDVTFTRTYLADTFRLKVRNQIKDLSVFNSLSEKQIDKAIWKILEKEYPAKYKEIRPHYKMLEFKEVGSVPEIDDDDIRDIPPNCTKVQLAVQYFSGSRKKENKVDVVKKVLGDLSRLERRLLPFHEAYLRKQQLENPDYENTAPVRAQVRGIMADAEVWDAIIRKLFIEATGKDPNKGFGAKEFALNNAVNQSRIEAVRRLLEDPTIKLNAKTPIGYTILDSARTEEIAVLLLEAGALFELSGSLGSHIIATLAMEGNLEGIRRMIARGAVPNHCGHLNRCGLTAAIIGNKAEVFDYLLQFQVPDLPFVIASAACAPEVRYLEKLLSRYPDFELNPRKGAANELSALHKAVECGKIEQVRLLLERGADVNLPLRAQYYTSPMQMARRYGHYEIAELLRSRGGKMGRTYRGPIVFTRFKESVEENKESLAIALIEEGMPVNYYTGSAFDGTLRGAHYAGTELDKFLGGRDTPLMLLATHGMIRGMEICVKHGAILDAVDHMGMTALHWAASTGNLEAVKFLVKNGATINLVDVRGWTPMTRAEQGSPVKEFLKSVGGVEWVE